MNEKRMNPDEVAAIRHKVQAAFSELRKVGFLTKTNFSCCMNCAVYELGEIAEKRRRNRAVYWHRQDDEHFRKGGLLHIRFCYLPPAGIQGDTTEMETQIGEQVAAAMQKTGLELDWNGSPKVSIQIIGAASPSTVGKDQEDAGTA